MTKTTSAKSELAKLLAQINQADLMNDFLCDLLSPREFEELAKRWQIIKKLSVGIPQREVAKDLKVGIATVTRGSIELQNKQGGFKKVLDKFYQPK